MTRAGHFFNGLLARCIENHKRVVMSGSVGNPPFVDSADLHSAQSGIFTPVDFSFARGGITSTRTPNIETMVEPDVDIENLRRHEQGRSLQNWNDGRTDLYWIR